MCDTAAKGTIEWDGRRVTIEGPEAFVSAELERFRDAALGTTPTRPARASEESGHEERPISDAQFLASKSPRTHYERIAVLAVRLKGTGKTEFDADDIRKAYLRANSKPPKVMSQALIDTKRLKDYIEPTESGKYRLTTHGEDFVQFELPHLQGANK